MNDDTRSYLRRTELDPAVAERLAARLRRQYADDPATQLAARSATTPDPRALARLRARLRDPGRVGRRWVPIGLAVAAAAAAGIAWWSRPPPSSIDHVALEMHGEGQLGGTRDAPVVTWSSGRLSVRVTPHVGAHFAVRTPEALVEVVGTVFTVERSRHATDVAVVEGRVRVACAGQGERLLDPGQHLRCLPADAASLLLRASELAADPDAAADQLAAADAGLAAAPPAAARAELLAHRTRALAALGRVEEALAAADAYLATGESPRRTELLAWSAETRFERDGCAATPALAAAVADREAQPAALLLATCVLPRDPARAAELVRAAGRPVDPRWTPLAQRLAERLGIPW